MEGLVEQLIEQNKLLMTELGKKVSEPTEKSSASNKISIHLEKFDEHQETFESYLERLEAFLNIQNVPEDKRGLALISNLSPKHYNLLKNLLAPDNPSDKSYDDLKKALKSHISPKPLIIPSRHVFLNRKQREGETISDYMAVLRSLSVPCAYSADMLNTMLRDVFVSGLRDKAILNRVFEEDDIKLEDTLKIALAMEKALKSSSDILERPVNIHGVGLGKTNKNVGKKGKFINNPKNKPCPRCNGTTDHDSNSCRFRTSECHFCKKIGHIEKACFSKQKQKHVKQKRVDLSKVSVNQNQNLVPLHAMGSEEAKRPPIMLTIKIEGKPVSMELDTGGAVSVMSLGNFRKISERDLQPTDIVFSTYSGEKIIPLGVISVNVEYKNQKRNLKLYIVKQNLDTIFGREWLYEINVDWAAIKSIRTSGTVDLNRLLKDYEQLFDDELGEINNYQVKLELKPDIAPKFCRARPVPFALQNRVEAEIDRLEKDGIIERVETSEWATPVVPVVKTDGSIRLCADYSVTLNPSLMVQQHPLPRLEEIFLSLNGGETFSKIDFKHAYLQLKVHENSQNLLTINTTKGLYKCKRLMFGLNAAPAIWQRYIDGLFQGMEGIKVFMDDVRVTGSNDLAHFEALEKFFKKCKEHGLKLNLQKSEFFKKEINFLGHKIDANGLHKTDEKISAIVSAPKPNNVQEVQSFLGLVQFYGKFCPNLATIANPLNNLTKKDSKFIWSKDCEKSFQNIKKEICSPQVLIHYDPDLPVTLATDASPVGLGAVLSHKMSDGTERPIAFASRTLTNTEKKYSQIDKEALAIVWAVKKFYLYLKGRRFTLITDHKPLVAIFGCKKGLPVLAATRLLHYALTLQSFQFDIIYRNTKEHGNADFLSRLPTHSEDLEVKDDVTLFQLQQIENLPVTAEDLAKGTQADDELRPLFLKLQYGGEMRGREAEYSLQDNCIMYGTRVMVPKIFQRRVLEELHHGHLGVVKMKAIARSFVYWKNIDKDIEDTAKNCIHCAEIKTNPQKVKVHHWEYPCKPWERIHIDFAGPLLGSMFLVIVDAHSKWLEVYPMKSTTSFKTIECLRDCFARFGLPVLLVSDNGPQFTSHEFKVFMDSNGIKHKTTAPFKPSSNGQAERYVFTLKQSLRAMQEYPGTLRQKLSTFLLQYRKAPNMTTLHSPAMLMLKREIRTRIDLVRPDLTSRVQDRIRKDNYHFSDRVFSIGDKVAVRNYRHGDKKWKFGSVVSKDGQLHYTVAVGSQLWRRHVDQMRDCGDISRQDWEQLPHAQFIQKDVSADSAAAACGSTLQAPASSAAEVDTSSEQFDIVLETPLQSTSTETAAEHQDSSAGHQDCSTIGHQPVPGPHLRRSARIRKAPQRLNL